MCNHRCLSMGVLTLIVGSLLTGDAQAQSSGGVGNAPRSGYRAPAASQRVSRSFGSAGRSPGSNVGSSLGGRLGGPTLSGAGRPNYTANRTRQFGNTPTRSRSPVLSPSLNMLPGATNNFGGQYLLRTQPFEAIDRQGQDFGRQLGALRQDLNVTSAAQGNLSTGDAFAPIQTGLTPTGHPVGFLNTGSYYP
jgi:hypothetical protein